MNKHCFRLVFSKPLGFLIPVAEITRSRRKSGQQETSSPASLPLVPPGFSLKRLVLSVLLAGGPTWAAADILLDPKNPSGTNVISAPNGVPVIEIANVSEYTRTIVRSLNKEASSEGYKGGPLVWHGDEANNPFSPGFDPNDQPVFFVPGKKPVRVTSKQELLKFEETLKQEGYTPGTSNRF